MELHTIRQQMESARNADGEMKRLEKIKQPK